VRLTGHGRPRQFAARLRFVGRLSQSVAHRASVVKMAAFELTPDRATTRRLYASEYTLRTLGLPSTRTSITSACFVSISFDHGHVQHASATVENDTYRSGCEDGLRTTLTVIARATLPVD